MGSQWAELGVGQQPYRNVLTQHRDVHAIFILKSLPSRDVLARMSQRGASCLTD